MKNCPACGVAVENYVVGCACGHKFEAASTEESVGKEKRKGKGRAADYWGVFLCSFAYLMINQQIAKTEWEGLIHYIPQAVGVALIPFLFLYFMSRKAGWMACGVLTLLALSNTVLERYVLNAPT
jgi:hypothetical protein